MKMTLFQQRIMDVSKKFATINLSLSLINEFSDGKSLFDIRNNKLKFELNISSFFSDPIADSDESLLYFHIYLLRRVHEFVRNSPFMDKT